jgi:hypothetical protein
MVAGGSTTIKPPSVVPYIEVTKPKIKSPKESLWSHVSFRLSNTELAKFDDIAKLHNTNRSEAFRIMLSDYYKSFKEQIK